MSNVSTLPSSKSRSYLEWSVIGTGMVGGVIIVVAALGYGLSNTTGVGAGFFPLVAGGAIVLGSLLWGIQLWAEQREAKAESAERFAGAYSDRAFDESAVDHASESALGALVVDGIDEEDDDVDLPDRRGVLRIAMVVAALVLAAVILPYFGYLLTMTVMLFAVMTLVSERKWWIALIVAVGAAFASRLVFETLLGTALPHPAIEFLRVVGL